MHDGPSDPPPYWLGLTRAWAAGVDLEQAMHAGLIPPQAFVAIFAACATCPDPQACDLRRRTGTMGTDKTCANADLLVELHDL